MTSEIIDEVMIVDDSTPTDSNNKQTVVGGLSMETFFTLSHALRAMTDCVKHLLDVKIFKYVLPGKMKKRSD